ncbi:MAG: acyl-CoA synthetase, partial [Actinobacteria bacterium]|nr:acyl-CoA synthetase [Actinomycetota bacterium]
MNFARDYVDEAPPKNRALVALDAAGEREEWTFADVAEASARLAGRLQRGGVERGDTVLTLVGNRPGWVLSLVACFRIGAVALPCTEQLRAADLAHRFAVARPRLILADERNRAELEAAAPSCPVLYLSPDLWQEDPPAVAVELAPTDPCLITFTSGTSGKPKAVVHAQRYLAGQVLQATHWLDARP